MALDVPCIVTPRALDCPRTSMGEKAVSTDGIVLLKGTLDMLVLKVLRDDPTHGFGITRRLQELTDEAFQVDEGSMYPALYRMQKRGWIKADWCLTENNRRAKIYKVTTAGRKRLEKETDYWRRVTSAVAKVMEPAARLPNVEI